jgi:hypothetical protein
MHQSHNKYNDQQKMKFTFYSPQKMSNQTFQSRAVALKFCDYVNTKNFALLLTLFTLDAKWYVSCQHYTSQLGRFISCCCPMQNVGAVVMPFKEWEFRVDGITAEDERVVVEVVDADLGCAIF